MDQKITVLIVDDHPVARAGVRSMLEAVPDLEVVGEAQDGDEAQKLVAELRPQVLLLDLKMPGLSVLELEKWVRVNHPETGALVLTAHDRDFYLSGMIEAGAAGYFDKGVRGETLIAGIRSVARGECLFTDAQIERARKWRQDAGKKDESLTERERQISKLLVRGLDDAAMAKALKVSPRTASSHVANLLKKLGVASRQEAVAWLLKHIPDIADDLV